MAESPQPSALKAFWQRLLSFFSRSRNPDTLELTQEVHLQSDSLRIPWNGQPLELTLGRKGKNFKRLHIYAEPYLTPAPSCPRLLILDPERFLSEINGFLKLGVGETLTLGRLDVVQESLFRYPITVSPRHVSLTFTGDALICEDLATESGTYLAPLLRASERLALGPKREANLDKVREICGGTLELLPAQPALELLKQVNILLQHEAHRPRDERNRPGGVVVVPDRLIPILVGDLHAQVDNLLTILSHNGFIDAMERHEAALVILGDAVHLEVDGRMEEMESSLLMMDLIFKLKVRFPAQVFYLRGNHDTFSPELQKNGIPQGVLWAKEIMKRRGGAYYHEMERFYDFLPYVALGRDFVACHAAPPKARVDTNLLTNITQYPGLAKELIWNRLARPNYPAGYTRGDVKRFRQAMGVSNETPFIVAHNPLSRSEAVWLDAGGIANHHILFSGLEHCTSVFTRANGLLTPLTYPSEPLLAWLKERPLPRPTLPPRDENET